MKAGDVTGGIVLATMAALFMVGGGGSIEDASETSQAREVYPEAYRPLTEAELRFESGGCVVQWQVNPFGDWLSTLQCDPSSPKGDSAEQSWEAQYRAAIAAVFPESERANAVAIVACETGSTFAPHAVGDNGRARGAFQTHARFWGPVPDDIRGQTEQAYRIWQRAGWAPWTCARILGIAG